MRCEIDTFWGFEGMNFIRKGRLRGVRSEVKVREQCSYFWKDRFLVPQAVR